MELRAVDGVRVAGKTVPKIMRELGLACGIRRGSGRRRYGSYRGVIGETFENVLGRDFYADAPWRKMGTDVTEFRCSFGKAYLAPVYDFVFSQVGVSVFVRYFFRFWAWVCRPGVFYWFWGLPNMSAWLMRWLCPVNSMSRPW